jgi:hypothetical protein
MTTTEKNTTRAFVANERESLDKLAAEINEAHRNVGRCGSEQVAHALVAGARLIEAKSRVKHGEWLPWLAENFEFSPRTAQTYMWLAQRAEDAQRVSHLGLGGVLAALRASSRGLVGGPDTLMHALIHRAANSERPERAITIGLDGLELAPADRAAASSARRQPEVRGYLAAISEVLGMLAEVDRGDCDLGDVRRRLLALRQQALGK